MSLCYQVLTAGSMMVSPDPRYSLYSGYSLRVEYLRGRDEGSYTCSVSTLSGPVTVTHNLEILGESMIMLKLIIWVYWSGYRREQSIDLQIMPHLLH